MPDVYYFVKFANTNPIRIKVEYWDKFLTEISNIMLKEGYIEWIIRE